MAIDTLGDLVEVIAALPDDDRAVASARLSRIVELSGQRREVAMGLLALDLAPAAQALGLRTPAGDTGGRLAC